MKITLTEVGKKFGREWIFRGVNHVFEEASTTVLLGANGSGKSTLLQVISGYVIPTEGSVEITDREKTVAQDLVHTCFAFASPYLELMEDFTFRECVSFQGKFRPWKNGLDENKIVELSGLSHAADKLIRHYSSGMKQRAKLTLAILSQSPVLLLDEPCSNLDQQAMAWYGTLITDFRDQQTVIVCSNQVQEEFFFCNSELHIEALKPAVSR